MRNYQLPTLKDLNTNFDFMKFIYFKYQRLLLGLLVIMSLQTNAQVSGISYTLSPATEYVWWNDQAGLDNGLLFGGKLGIGFGEYFELRGNYMRSLDLQTNFSNFGFANYDETLFRPIDISMTRWGGELKANLSKGKLLPFVTIGTGVQSFEIDSLNTSKRIYAQVGGGVKLSAGDRYTLTLEAKNAFYNFNAADRFLSPEDRVAFGAVEDDLIVKRLSNWSVGASLQFYLGGRRPGELSDLDRAYFQSFSTGLKDFSFPIEPTLVKMNFNDALPYRDTWLAGGYAGFDFGPYVGVRGFYFKAMADNKLTTDFDKLAMYGGEIRMNLNASKGTIPYLIAGGGYININEEEYIGRADIEMTPVSQTFAMGGGGLILPINNRFKIFGSARALLTSGTNFDDLEETDQLKTSWMYSFGVNLTLGKKATDPSLVAQSRVDANTTLLKSQYETKILELEQQLNRAYSEQDIERAADILEEKSRAEQVVDELDKRKVDTRTRQFDNQSLDVFPSNSKMNMSPAEFQLLIAEILENMGTGGQRIAPVVGQQLGSGGQDIQTLLKQQELEKQISEIEKLLIQMNERALANDATEKSNLTQMNETVRRDLSEFSTILLSELQKLNEKVYQNNQEIQRTNQGVRSMENRMRTNGEVDGDNSYVPPTSTTPSAGQAPAESDFSNDISNNNSAPVGLPVVRTSGNFLGGSKSITSNLSYQGMSGIAGFSLGKNTTANVGFRWHYQVGDTRLEVMPETFFGFGSPANFGISLNGISKFPLKQTSIIKPYIGAGLGFMQIGVDGENRLKGAVNILVGSYVKFAGGRVFIDLTGRNLFKYNQAIVGYRFAF